MQTSSGEATLVSKNDQKILPMTGSELTDNTWGYSLGSGFAAVPATQTDSSAAELANAYGSICQKGWQLPSSRDNTEITDIGGDVTFYDLLARYGYTFPGEDERKIRYGATAQNGYNLNLKPCYFTKSSQIDLNDGSLSSVGAKNVATVFEKVAA